MKNREIKIAKSVDDYWAEIIEKYSIIEEINTHGQFKITANQIKEFKEPRLMAKWDSKEGLPSVFKDNGINILPISRSAYTMGRFKLYEELPELKEHVTKMSSVIIPEFETIDINNISSESNAINVLSLSGILDDFLNVQEGDSFVGTFNGRMGTGSFKFNVKTDKGSLQSICVNNAQCEIDGGFENSNSIIIMEAKNVVHPDFHVRQLYYPYRLWRDKVRKPIKLIFSVYSNQIYRLFEYEFIELNNYSSIRRVREKNYSLQDTRINMDEVVEIWGNTVIEFTDDIDNKNELSATFIQANSVERIISLLENLYENPLSLYEIAELMKFDKRQSDYYYNAGKYLQLFEKDTNEQDEIVVSLTKLGNKLMKLKYKERVLKFIGQIFKHQIFHELFKVIKTTGEVPDINYIRKTMVELNVTTEKLLVRRSSSVQSWLMWIINITEI